MQTSDVVIRAVRADDAAQLRDNCFSANTLEEVQEHIAQNLKAATEGKSVQLVAVVDGVPIGIVTLERRSHPLKAHRAEMIGLVVDPRYQRQGIARMLVAECRTRASQMGIQVLETSCRAGQPPEQVFRQLGFLEYGRLPRGLVEVSGDNKLFDEVYFYQLLERKR